MIINCDSNTLVIVLITYLWPTKEILDGNLSLAERY